MAVVLLHRGGNMDDLFFYDINKIEPKPNDEVLVKTKYRCDEPNYLTMTVDYKEDEKGNKLDEICFWADLYFCLDKEEICGWMPLDKLDIIKVK